ncbi:hypothetical protein MRX96_046352 [Rhipicephalus microplus]
METSSDDSCCVTKTGESNSCDSVFERLFSAVSCVSLPQPSWAAHLINLAGVRDVVFIDAAVAHRTSDGSSVLFNRKALHVKSNMEVQVYILDKLIDSAAIGTGALERRGLLSRFAGRLEGTPGDLSSPLKATLISNARTYRSGLHRQSASRWRCAGPGSRGCDKSQKSRVKSREPDSGPLDSSKSPSELVLLESSPRFGVCVQRSGGR